MTDFQPTEPESEQPIAPVRYDLAGNPLPPDPVHSPPYPQAYQGAASAPRPQAHPNPAPVPPMPDPRPFTSPAGLPYVPQKQASPGKTIGFIAAGALLLVVLGAVFWTRAKHPLLIAPPGSYSLYVSPDKTFTCQAPVNWDSHGFGTESSSVGGVTFQKGDAKIEITSDFQGSLFGDIFKPPAGPDGNPMPQRVPPIERLHAMYRSTVSQRYGRYREGDMLSFSSPGFGDARCSEFRARRGPFGPDLRGVRVTMLGTERAMIVVCECPAANWETLRDSFWMVVTSIQQGHG